MSLILHIRGAEPASKQSVRFVNGRAVGVMRVNKALKKWASAIVAAVADAVESQADAIERVRSAEALSVAIRFLLPARRGGLHTSPPDLDNLTKATLDVLEDAGVLVDDARVVELHVSKVGSRTHKGADVIVAPTRACI